MILARYEVSIDQSKFPTIAGESVNVSGFYFETGSLFDLELFVVGPPRTTA